MNENMVVDWDAAKKRFLITCPFWANNLVQQLPDRRWLKGARAWAVPCLRLNVEKLTEFFKMTGVRVTDAAQSALTSYQAAKARINNDKFPTWYPFRKTLTRVKDGAPIEFKLRKHALKALDKMWGKHCFALHHDMGTNKTRTYIDLACAKRMNGEIDAMAVVVKLSGRRNWKEQFVGPMTVAKEEYKEGWAPIPADIYLPTSDNARGYAAWTRAKHDFPVLVVGVESLSQGRMPDILRDFVMTHGKVMMVIDEAHLIANHKAIRTEHCVTIGKQAAWRGTATGTPISTGPLNLFSQFEFLDPDIVGIGDFYAFRNQYAVVLEQKTKAGQKYPMIVGYKNLDELTKTVAPYVDEVRKSDVLPDLPPKNYLPHVMVTLSPPQRKMYDQIRAEGAYLLKGKETVVKNVLELALRLHTVCGGYAATYEEVPYIGRGGEEKIRRIPTWHEIVTPERNPKFIELVDICSASRQFIVWAAYRAEVAGIVSALQRAYPKSRICEIHGGIDEGTRAAYRNAYQKGDYQYMVGNTATGGTADTWTSCESMIYFNNTQKMIDRAQSEDRAHRDGLDHKVDYVDLVAENTVEEAILKSIAQTMDLAEYLRVNIRRAAEILDGGPGA